MYSAASGLTALSPSVGAVEDFIEQKNIPADQVPAFLARLGDPRLAGLIAQKQRLKQAQAQQVPPGSAPPSPPTVKDDINRQLLLATNPQLAMRQAPQGIPTMLPQQGVPQQRAPQNIPMQVMQQGVPAQGVPQQGIPQQNVPVRAARGGSTRDLMAHGIGGLDAGALEAPRHFDGGGIVAFNGENGSEVTDDTDTVKSKEELEKELAYTDPNAAQIEFYKQRAREINARKAYVPKYTQEQISKDEELAIAKQRQEAEKDYDESTRQARIQGALYGLKEALSGKSAGLSLLAAYEDTAKRKKEAADAYSAAKKDLDSKLLTLHKANMIAENTASKEAYDFQQQAQNDVAAATANVYSMAQQQAATKFENDMKTRATVATETNANANMLSAQAAWQNAVTNKEQEKNARRPTDQTNATNAYLAYFKELRAKGVPGFAGESDASLEAKAYEKAKLDVTAYRAGATAVENAREQLKSAQTALMFAQMGGNQAAIAAAQAEVNRLNGIINSGGQSNVIGSVGSGASSSNAPTYILDATGKVVSTR